MTDQKEKEFAEGLYINESDKDFIKLKIGIKNNSKTKKMIGLILMSKKVNLVSGMQK